MSLLKVDALNISINDKSGNKTLVHDISFEIKKGEILGIVGESGSGKSITALSILKLLEDNPSLQTKGSIAFNSDNEEVNIISANEESIRNIRGNKIAMIFQEPMTALNPVMTCGDQIREAILVHHSTDKKSAKQKVIELLEKVKIQDAKEKYDAYPHQLSGGQKQRVMIAMAIANNPDLLIADEPTTALDVTVQKEILSLLQSLIKEYGMSMIFISHDLGLVTDFTDNLLVMYNGAAVEKGITREVISNPQNPYTKALLACRPASNTHARRLPVVKDFLENKEQVKQEPVYKSSINENSEVLIEVENLSKHYSKGSNLLSGKKEIFKAVDDVSFTIRKGEILGLVGESGCGKTTLSRCMLMLIQPTSGSIKYKGENIINYSASELRLLRKQIQIIFQDPYSSLNPRLTVGDMISEPMKVHRIYSTRHERKDKAIELLEKVGLNASHYNRYAHEFSGGQRQRICIARALAVQPEFIICDESVSALDVSVQAQVLNLLNDLKDEFKLTYLFISHDLSVVKYMSDNIIVMKNGRIEEAGTSDEVFNNPKSPYTRKLIDAIPGKNLLSN